MKISSIFTFVVLSLLNSPIGSAQENLPQSKTWKHELQTDANISFTQTQDVVGKTDGTSSLLGYDFKYSVNFLKNNWEWKNAVSAAANFSKTPSIDELVKSSDELKLLSDLLYFLNREPSFGLYSKAGLETSVFKGKDVEADTRTFTLTFRSGLVQTKTGPSLKLTDPLKPIKLNQSFGLFYFPIREERISSELRSGLAANEVFAKGQFVLADIASTSEIEAAELRNYQQLGLEASAKLYGEYKERNWSYDFSADWFLPLVKGSASGDTRNSLKLLNQKYQANLKLKLMEWLSVSYKFSLQREPQLVSDYQLSNGIFFSLSKKWL